MSNNKEVHLGSNEENFEYNFDLESKINNLEQKVYKYNIENIQE